MKKLADRMSRLDPSATFAMTTRYKALVAEGKDAISFSVGEPDFDTPEHIRDAGIAAINEGFTRYTQAGGIPELKAAVVKKLKRDNQLEYSNKNIIVGTGAKQALYNAFRVLCQEGDEVILPAPYWGSYTEIIKMSEATPVIVDCLEDNGFKMTPQQFEAAITPRTKCLLLNSPSNPSGAVYTEDELRALADLIVKYDLYVVADEIYEKLIYSGSSHVSIASLNEEIKKRTVIINGWSKTYAMTGWRLGFAAANEEIISAMEKYQGHSTANPTSIVQKAGLAALEGPQECVAEMKAAFAKRRDYMVEAINKIPGLSCLKPDGAFYVMFNIQSIIGRTLNGAKINNSMDFCEALLEQKYVATVPGSAFGMEGFVRLSYAASMEQIKEGLKRIAEFVK